MVPCYVCAALPANNAQKHSLLVLYSLPCAVQQHSGNRAAGARNGKRRFSSLFALLLTLSQSAVGHGVHTEQYNYIATDIQLQSHRCRSQMRLKRML